MAARSAAPTEGSMSGSEKRSAALAPAEVCEEGVSVADQEGPTEPLSSSDGR